MNMNIRRKFIMSCEIFNGYECVIDVNACNTNADIISIAVTNLRDLLSCNKLNQLTSKLEEIQDTYHIHNVDIGEILISDQSGCFYICSHK